VGAISQTTQSTENFLRCVEAIAAKRPVKLKVCATICKDAEMRQAAARDLARAVDVMLVVGGRNSANTKRLFVVCKKISRGVHLVETEGEVRRSWFKGVSKIGITSGASTPDWIIKRVINKINLNPKSQKSKPKL
jgi:4-hydroxy-3-methylbut-2-enyl diphosphate reductase